LIGVRAGVAALSVTVALGSAAGAAAASSEPLYDLIDAAIQRLLTADPVAATKWLNGGPITDPARVRQVLDAVSADARQFNCQPST
jgi:chorismate mutase